MAVAARVRLPDRATTSATTPDQGDLDGTPQVTMQVSRTDRPKTTLLGFGHTAHPGRSRVQRRGASSRGRRLGNTAASGAGEIGGRAPAPGSAPCGSAPAGRRETTPPGSTRSPPIPLGINFSPSLTPALRALLHLFAAPPENWQSHSIRKRNGAPGTHFQTIPQKRQRREGNGECIMIVQNVVGLGPGPLRLVIPEWRSGTPAGSIEQGPGDRPPGPRRGCPARLGSHSG